MTGSLAPPGSGNAHCSVMGWHAVRMPTIWGMRVLGRLDQSTGAVIENQNSRRMYWLVPVDGVKDWELPAAHDIEVLGDGYQVLIPGTLRRHALWWLVPPRSHRLLTDPDELLAAITVALGPQSEATAC